MLAASELDRYILHPEEETKETVYEFWDRKERRIERIYRKGKVQLIKAIERFYEDQYEDDACDAICKMLQGSIQGVARRWSRSARLSGIRLYADDFEEVFLEAVLEVIWYDYNSGSDFWLYEHIMKKMRSNALDLIKWAKRDKRVHDYMAVNTEKHQIADQRTSNLENNVIDTVLIQLMMSEPSLGKQERALLRYLYDTPEATLREIAESLALGHPQTASRLLQKVQKKLVQYRNLLER